jgi:putative hydrolase of the HAD superfamily
MSERRVIFFDVGNTLLFPNRAKMLAPIPSNRHPTLAQWQALERRTKQEFDQGMQTGGVDHSFWWTFHTHLLQDLAEVLGEDLVGNTAIRDALIENTQNSANWDQILPGTRDALDRISQNFRIAVISNADGGIERVLTRCGIAHCFESITDSGIVGVEKPRREILEAALTSMKAQAKESLYVGDVYSVDYLGARNAGMEAVLLDVSGAYRDRDLPRVESVEQLERRLQQ